MARVRRREEIIFQAEELKSQAEALLEQGHLEGARETILRAIVQLEAAVGESDGELLRFISVLGIILNRVPALEEAEVWLKRALEIARQDRIRGTLEEARAQLDLGFFYDQNGRTGDAVAHAERAVTILEQILSSGPEEEQEPATWAVGEAYRLLGMLHSHRLNFTDAEDAFMKSISAYESLGGGIHEEIGRTLIELARLYRDQMDYERADLTFRRAHAMLERTIGPWHVDLGFICEELASLHESLGNPIKARELIRKATVTYQHAAGKRSRDYIRSLDHMSAIFVLEENFTEALGFSERAVKLAEGLLEDTDPDLVTLIDRLATIHRELGNTREAEELEKRAAKLASKAYQ